MCNEHFGIVNGKFKLPFLRGEYGPHSPHHYKEIEETIANDLNTWLCNLYIEIRNVPMNRELDSEPVTVGLNYITKSVDYRNDDSNHEESKLIKSNSKSMLKESKEDALAMNIDKVAPKTFLDKSLSRSVFFSHRHGDYRSDQRELMERGYEVGDEFFMLGEQRGELPGLEATSTKIGAQWAAMGLEGKVVRRLRFDGSRYDMDIMSDQGGGNGDLCDSDIIVDDKVSPSYEYQYGRKKLITKFLLMVLGSLSQRKISLKIFTQVLWEIRLVDVIYCLQPSKNRN